MPPPFNPAGAAQQQKKKLKAPAVLIAHYTAKGMDERAASQKVIEDLQKALAFSFESYPTQKVMMMDKVVKSNVESFHQRLSQIEAKVTSSTNLFLTSFWLLNWSMRGSQTCGERLWSHNYGEVHPELWNSLQLVCTL